MTDRGAPSPADLLALVEAQGEALSELQREVAALRARLGDPSSGAAEPARPDIVAATDAADVEPLLHEGDGEAIVSRRRLIGRTAVGVAVGAAVLAARPEAAAAANGDPLLVGVATNQASNSTKFSTSASSDGFWIDKTVAGSTVLAATCNADAIGVYGRCAEGRSTARRRRAHRRQPGLPVDLQDRRHPRHVAQDPARLTSDSSPESAPVHRFRRDLRLWA